VNSTLYLANVTVHVIAALIWLGGLFFFALVGAPALRTVEPPELRARLFRMLGERARSIGWIAIAVLTITGIANLYFRSVLDPELLLSSAFWATRYGNALAWKLAAVAAMVLVSALHDFVYGPGASRHPAGSPEARAARLRAAWLGRVNAIIGIVIVFAAVRLARGG
jgi:putative copper resistance protein D